MARRLGRPGAGGFAFLLPAVLAVLGAAPVAWADPAFFFTLSPCRAFDSRSGTPLDHGATTIIPVAGTCGVPASASSVALNVTVIQPSGTGDLALFDADGSAGLATISFGAGQTRANNAVVQLSTAGAIAAQPSIPPSGTVHVIVDLAGYFVDNLPPVADDDAFDVDEDSVGNALDVLNGDADVESDPFSIASATQPANGTVVLTGGSPGAHTGLEYTPDANYCNDPPGTSPDTFTYALNPGGDTGTVSVKVACSNDAPAGTDNTVTAVEDIDYVFTAADFGFTDPDDAPANLLSSVDITTLPALGSLTLSGGAVSAGDDISVANISGGNLKFKAATDQNGLAYTSFTFKVQDDGGTSPGVDLDPSANTMTIDVTSVNDAPEGTDNTVTTNEDTDYVFTAADFGFSDPSDSPANALFAVDVTTLPGAGSLTLSNVAVAAGQDIAVGDIHLGNLKFGPALNANGATYASFTFKVQDNGGVLNSGADLDPVADTLTIDVTALNDAPVVTTTNGTTSWTEGTPATVDSGVTASDVDDSNLESATVTIFNPLDGALEALSASGCDGSLTVGAPGHTLSISGTSSLANYQACLALVTYDNTDNDPDLTDRQIDFKLNDGDVDSAVASKTVVLTAVDDAPTAVDDSTTVAEDAAATQLLVLGNDTDPDGGTQEIASATDPSFGTVVVAGDDLSLTYQPDANYCATSVTDVAYYRLGEDDDPAAVDAGTGDATTVDSAGSLDLTRNDAPSYAAATPGAVTSTFAMSFDGANDFYSAATVATAVTDNFGIEAWVRWDGTGSGSGIIAYNGSPSGGSGWGLRFFSGFYAPSFGFTQPGAAIPAFSDWTHLALVRDSGTSRFFVNGVQVSTLTLSVPNPPSTASSGGMMIGGELAGTEMFPGEIDEVRIFTFAAGTFSVSDLHLAGLNRKSPDTFDYTLNPGSDTGQVSVDVTCVDDQTVANNDAKTVDEDASATPINVIANDTDVDGGHAITVVSDPDNGTAAIIPGGSAVTYQPDANYCNTAGSPDTFTYEVDPGDVVATVSVTVNCQNDAPTGTDNTVSTPEETDYVFAAADFGFADAADTPPNALLAVTLTTLPSSGSLTLSGGAVSAGQSIAVADITAGDLEFSPAANANGSPYATFTFQVQDDGGTSPGVDLDPSANTMTIDVTSVNDAPAGTDNTVTTNEDTDHTFAAVDFGFSDPNDTPANNLLAVKIASLPALGSLTLSNVAVTLNQSIAVADITGGNLEFTPAANASGTSYASFTFQVRDDGGTSPGVDLDPSANTMTIDVTSVNDAPAGTDNTVTTNEDTDYTFAAVDFGFSDPSDTPANNLLAVRIASLPALGSLTLSNVAVTLNQSIAVADITGGNLEFTPAANASGTGYASFTFQVRDDGGTSPGVDLDPSANTMTLNVTAVNDAPVLDADMFDFIGNTELRVDLTATATPQALETTTSGFGVVDGDTDIENDGLLVTSITVGACTDNTGPDPLVCSDPLVGTVSMLGSGKFSFVPAASDTGDAPTGCPAGAIDKETFTYTVTDTGVPNASSTATVTMCRFGDRIWYVENDGGGGTGTSTDPFATLLEAETASAASDYIFVEYGDGTTTGQAAGIVLKNDQHLLGEFAGLSIPVDLNGNGSPTILLAQPGGAACGGNPCRPAITHTAGDAVSATDVIPIEIVGLSLSSTQPATGSAIDWTTTGAFAGTGTLTIKDNVVTSATGEGVDIDLAGTAGVNLAFRDNSLTATGTGLDIQETGTGSLTITAFDDNTVSGLSGGNGVNINTATFDANTATGGFQTVYGGITLIGSPGNPVTGAGMTLANVEGDLRFGDAATAGDLDIFAGSSALQVTGTGSGMTFHVRPVVPTADGTSTLDADNGAAVSITSATIDLRLDDLDSTTTGSGVLLSSVTGTLSTDGDASITKSSGAGTAFSVASSGSGTTVTYAGTLNVTSGAGVSLTSNTGSTIAFTGDLDLSTGTNTAFNATGGGTVTATNTDSTLTTTSGTALNVASTTIGALGLKFKSISAGTSGSPTNGIVLNTTGSAGSLTVAGTGSAGTGGTIQNTTGDGISLTSTTGPSFSFMNLTNTGRHGIFGTGVNGLTLISANIQGAGDADNEDALNFSTASTNNLTGTVAITNSTINAAEENGLNVANAGGSASTLNLTVNNTDFTNMVRESGINLSASGAATITAKVFNGCAFTANERYGVQGSAAGASGAALNLTISGNTFTGDGASTIDGGFAISAAGSNQVRFDIDSNQLSGPTQDAIVVQSASTSSVQGFITNNTLGNSGVVDSGSGSGSGVALLAYDSSDLYVEMSGNQIYHTELEGIYAQADDTESPDLQLNMTSNTVGAPDIVSGAYGAQLRSAGSGAAVLCANVQNNTVAGSGGAEGIRVRQGSATATFRLERLNGGSGTVNVAATVAAHVASENTATASASLSTSFNGVSNGFCTDPALTPTPP